MSTALALRSPRSIEVLPPIASDDGCTGAPRISDLRPFQMVGPAMEPTIPTRHWVLVDHNDRVPTDAIFLVDTGGGPRLARVQCFPPMNGNPAFVEITHDNPAFDRHPYVGPASRVRFIGRVVYHMQPL